jgi:hypothetical protein
VARRWQRICDEGGGDGSGVGQGRFAASERSSSPTNEEAAALLDEAAELLEARVRTHSG